MKDQKSQGGSVGLGMEIMLCRKKKENWKLSGGNTVYLNQTQWQPKLPLLDPNH